MNARAVLSCIAVAALVGAARTSFAQADGAAPIALPEKGFDFAIDPESGAVAVLYPAKDTVTLYPKLARGDAGGAVARTSLLSSPDAGEKREEKAKGKTPRGRRPPRAGGGDEDSERENSALDVEGGQGDFKSLARRRGE